ncbi:hypothetical protein MHYP_G00280390 [Metynnis hypsauchen]
MDPAELDPIKSALQNQGAAIGRHEQLLHDMMQQLTLLVRAQAEGAQPASAGTGVAAGASAAAPVLASPLPPTDPTPIRGDALVANPERYAGDPETCRGFLLQCSLVFEQQPSRFPTERSKVAYMISLLTGRALAWATSLWERASPDTASGESFMRAMRTAFHNPRGGREAAPRLLALSQGTCSVADYAIEFRTLAAESGWNEEALMAVFQQGLNGRLKDELTTRELPSTLEGLYDVALMLLDQYRKKSKLFRTKVVLVPLGDDFRYTEAQEWDQQFNNYQKLFDYMNSHPELHVQAQFGTISDYFEILRKHVGMDKVGMSVGVSPFPVLSGDFFTYADRDDHYWSGYFTSRPFYKQLDRTLESHLRAAEILYSLAFASVQKFGKPNNYPAVENYKLLTAARRNLGLFQHHDAIAGTGKDWVVVDYGTRLFHSILNLKRVIVSSAHWLVLDDKQTYTYDPANPLLQIDEVQSAQDALPRKTVFKISTTPRSFVVYNPSEQARTSVISIYVTTPHVHVLTAHGQLVNAQISAVWEDISHASTEAFQLSFVANVPPLGLAVYQLCKGAELQSELAHYMFLKAGGDVSVTGTEHFRVSVPQEAVPVSMENPHLQLSISYTTGLLETLKLKEDGSKHSIKVEFLCYGTTSKKDKSGAYLFLPDGEATKCSPSQPAVIRVTKGPVFSEVTTTFTHVTHTLRLYNINGVDGQAVEISNSIDIRGEFNREIAMRITSDLNSKDRFFTDLNGFQVQPRRSMTKLPLQANFYPMTSMAYLEDSGRRLTLLTAQSLGATSLRSGQLEVIMDRRLNQDDNRGLGQGVLDNKITANSFRLLLELFNSAEGAQRENTTPFSYPSVLSHVSYMYLNHPFMPMVKSLDSTVLALAPYSPLSSPFPCDIHLVNLRTIQSQEKEGGPSEQAALILHRKGFDCSIATKNTGLQCRMTGGKIHLEQLLTELKVISFIPVSLSLMHQSPRGPVEQEINLKPMEICTYRVQLR